MEARRRALDVTGQVGPGKGWTVVDNPLVGTWRLVSFDIKSSDGRSYTPYGPDVVGYIVYTPDGYVSVAFMSKDRPRFASGSFGAGTPEENAAAASTYTSYCGTYEFLGDRAVHRVEVSLLPNYIGSVQERFVEIDGDVLTIDTPRSAADGAEWYGHLVWQRA